MSCGDTLRFSGSSWRPAYPGFMVMKIPTVGTSRHGTGLLGQIGGNVINVNMLKILEIIWEGVIDAKINPLDL